jgi:signal recognition particle subunit SEC65
MPTKTKRVKKNKAVQNNRPHFISHIAESELQAIAEVDFNQPGVYNWSKKITPSVADKKGVNPLVRITILYINNFYNSIY